MAGPLGFEPRISGSAGQCPNPDQTGYAEDTRLDPLTRLRAHTKGLPHEALIISTLVRMKNNGLSDNTPKGVSHKLNQIAKTANLLDPEEVKTYIANAKLSNASKQKLANSHQYFAKTHSLPYEKPRYKWERKIPLIPTTENVHKIISASSRKYATIFTILEETGLETITSNHQQNRNRLRTRNNQRTGIQRTQLTLIQTETKNRRPTQSIPTRSH
jgi:hypothetical protein